VKITEGKYALGALTIFAAWIFIGLPLLYWPEAIREYYQYPTHSAQSSAGCPNGSSQTPFFVQILPGPDAAERANQENEDRLDKKNADRWLVRWTMALFFATALLFVVTGGLGFFAYQQIRLTRDEFNATHRPKIRVKHVWLESDIWQDEPVTVKLTCVNTGIGVAILQEVGIKFHVIRNDRNLPQPKIDATYRAGKEPLLPGRNYEFPPYSETILTPELNVCVHNRTHKLLCVGYVSYLDASERLRITGFCRVLEFPENSAGPHKDNSRFRLFKDSDYEYED
jgi:hypothetical protein